MRKIEKGHSYLLTQAMRAASRGVSRSKIAQRISSGRTRRSPRASVLRSLWLCCVWASIIKCQFQFLLSSAAALNWIYSFIILFVPTLRSTAFLCVFFLLFLEALPTRVRYSYATSTRLRLYLPPDGYYRNMLFIKLSILHVR